MAGERRLYLERNCRLPESPAHSRRRNREGPASSKGLNSQRGFGPAVEPRRKSRPRSTSLHGSSPCKCQRLSTLRWDRLPPSRPSTKSGARAGGRRLSDRRLHRWLAGTSASAPSSHGAADLLGLNRAHICVRNHIVIHGSTAVRGRGDLVAYRWALWKLTASWTHRTRPPHLGKRCAFPTSSTGPFPSNHSRKTPKGPKIALGNPDRPSLWPSCTCP